MGTREGYEAPRQQQQQQESRKPKLEVINGGPDEDIIDHVDEGSDDAIAFAKMKQREPSFEVGTFLQGARGAYEMILMGFERGELAEIKPFLGDEVYDVFAQVVEAREKKFVGDITSVVRDNAGEIVEGEEGKVKTQKDIWTFEREMGSDDLNWLLVATGE